MQERLKDFKTWLNTSPYGRWTKYIGTAVVVPAGVALAVWLYLEDRRAAKAKKGGTQQ